jgi:GNAT superfamily N-acetyltransferase
MPVTRTWLEIAQRSGFRPSYTERPGVEVRRVTDCSIWLFRWLYATVGGPYGWTDRAAWSDDEVARHLENPAVSIWVMTVGGATAGYVELRMEPGDSAELAYFGLLPAFIGQGLGKHLLSVAVEQAYAAGARRVWLHTCTKDHPSALPNYLARGFVPFRTEVVSS